MQIKIFTIPIIGGEKLTEELNVFLRSQKILHIERQIATSHQGTFWSFCINYLDENHQTVTGTYERGRIDYREVLDMATFARFSKMRELRKHIAQEEGIPAFAIFRDDELAGIAQLETLTLATMKNVKGVGDKKTEKYGQRFITAMADETGK